ncbi:DUF5686 and carboxypeptidase regulatory-like domain-containing protein [Sediminibacterium ginsengisoli]|uniref:CarboxypepD_reg-like domain-containing protein n=1 Tax=Sediminibacterium ginsengisoli TaxID=413434 RepID=A0A1T4L8Q7_9BACT|nr:DUF5686 and carboxypeptidase regulatory-like domain-containing protein [Sediminibacterium ginsengisoli]SJZ51023.1 CarboxypepD_reg-like domain-containing protein [Sediminibacterium ginsengisoli]
MRRTFLFLVAMIAILTVQAATISGTVKEAGGNPLPFSTIIVKGSTQGVTANGKGFYSITLKPGSYTLVCQYIGHKTVEKQVKVEKKDEIIDFVLEAQSYSLNDVAVKSGGEDPAYEIIRKTIARRSEHLNEIKSFQCEVYLKGQMQLRNYPTKFLGQKVDFEDGDTSKRKMLFLSESVARYSVEQPRNEKIEVISTKVSGRSNGFGLGSPQIVSFYENNISLGEGLNPRGFISPISDHAINYYRYKFEGTFYENGVEINRIKVTPRRAYEPLFTGYINIIENEWRLQSVQLLLLQKQQMQLLDTLKIEQLYVPAGKVWVIKSQVIYPSGKFLGFDFFGNFVQVYDKFDLEPAFKKKFFDNTVIKYFDSSNKKSMAYWDSIRPLPLLQEEIRDYKKKDSLEQARKDPRYLDSLDRRRNKITIGGLLLTGQSISKQKRKEYINFESILGTLNYNTVEGGVLNFSPSYTRAFGNEGRKSLFITPVLRYGFANGHFNVHVNGSYNFGKKYIHTLSIGGGKTVLQYNNANPISERNNSISTLLYEANHMKIYEATFFRISYGTGIGNGLSVNASFQFQNRAGLNNLADMTRWKDVASRDFTPNYPEGISNAIMPRNQASTVSVGLTWRPGSRYIEFPDRKISIGSKFPVINASVTKGINGLFGSDVDYTKWRVTISDELNLKMAGNLDYRFAAGGFFNADKVFAPDYNHIMGNQTILANDYRSSFQLAPYYQYSNTAKFYGTAHVNYHLNGLLTNKIPGFRRLNWFLVAGANALHIDGQKNYYEVLIGLENILKVLRVDFVQGFESGGGRPSGIRISLPFVQ